MMTGYGKFRGEESRLPRLVLFYAR